MPSTFASAGDSQGTRDPNILKLEPTNKVRPLDNLVAEWKQHGIRDPKDPEKFTSVVCPGPRSCPLCRKPVDPDKPENDNQRFPMSRRFACNVWDYQSQSVKVLIAGPQVFDEFKTNAQVGIDIPSWDWTITREGASRQTKYSVVRMAEGPGPQVTDDMLHDISKYESPDSPERIFDALEKFGIDYDSLSVPVFNEAQALAYVMPYTQHKGLTIEKLLAADQQFAEWMHGTKLEQGSFGDPVFVALQAALEARKIVPPLEEAMAAIPDPIPATGSQSISQNGDGSPSSGSTSQSVAETTSSPSSETSSTRSESENGSGATSGTDSPNSLPETSISDPRAGEIRMVAPNGLPVNIPATNKDSLLAAGFSLPAEEPEESESDMIEVVISGNTVTLPRSQAAPLLESGAATEVQTAPEPEPEPVFAFPQPDEVVKIAIAGNPAELPYAQACPLVDSETAVFSDPTLQGEYMRRNQKIEDAADAESVQQQAAAEHDAGAAEAEGDEKLLKCPYCPKTFKSKGGLSNHKKKEHPEGQGKPTEAAPSAATAPAQAAPTNGGETTDTSLLEKVKNKVASAPFAKDYQKILTVFDEETGKKNIMEMTDAELAKLDVRLDREMAVA